MQMKMKKQIPLLFPKDFKFQSFSMSDGGTNGDAIANDGIYSCVMPFNSGAEVKFYIKARNGQAMILSPERAEYEFYTYSTISNLLELPNTSNKRLVKITDILGRPAAKVYNQPLIYIYSDGSTEKKIISK